MKIIQISITLATVLALGACASDVAENGSVNLGASDLLQRYAPVRLAPDLESLTDNERHMIPILIEAAEHMDTLFWLQAYGDPKELLEGIADPDLRAYSKIN